ncbi:MAG: CoA pyrophosphatase [candidate division WOR-3 bacterium]|jgi:8-oxo-dGTP pyrophosphatase MutT (NUDIX family)
MNINPIRSAVLVPILNNKELLLIKRSRKLKYHPGEIAFPGGIIENNESPIETAIREIYEELSIKREYIEVIGLLEGVFISRTNFHIIPVLAHLNPKALNEIVINYEEVEEVLIYTIEELKNLKRVIIPGYWYVFCSSKGVIWGATARIISELLNFKIFI